MIKYKLAKLFQGIEIGAFDTAKDWGNDTKDYYYKYFNDKDNEIRAGAILAFTAMLGNLYNGPADVFRTKSGVTYLPKEQFYFFEDYLSAFLVNAPSIKWDFPNLHSYTVYYLYKLDKQEAFELVFPQIEQELFKKMRAQLFLIEHSAQINPPAFNKMLREVGLPTFFPSWD